MSGFKKEEIGRLRREEESRGRRLLPEENRIKEQAQREREYRALLASMDRQQFLRAIEALGHKPGTSEYEELVSTWREYQQDLKQQRQRRRHR